ncbi:MAG: 4-amino-4-deoxy-L-arabinose transferase-like glycosyltransferase, partial [Polaribacter sp.]
MTRFLQDIPKPIWIFSTIWFILGCLQAGLMELHPDEAYYWQMSRFMDWGYFHQPPMVAVFIKAGYALFQNELGVRLVTVICSSIGVLLLFKLSETKD